MSNAINGMIQDHIDNQENPHNVSKYDVGLGNVQNFPVATQEEAFRGSEPERFITPARLKDVFDGLLVRKGLIQKLGHYYNEEKGEWYFNQMYFENWDGVDPTWVDFGKL